MLIFTKKKVQLHDKLKTFIILFLGICFASFVLNLFDCFHSTPWHAIVFILILLPNHVILAKKYHFKSKNIHKIDLINKLLISVDVIPNSIVLAQAVNESGWGTSRFAKEYNALFGQYTYDINSGVVPYEREKGKKHLVKNFATIDKSVESYFKNINTHYAYEKFRLTRKLMRDKNNFSNINLLVYTLNTYAEDNNYVETISSIIESNKLSQFDVINYTPSKS